MTAIDTAAMKNIVDVAAGSTSKTRKVEIMSDACAIILQQPSTFTGNFCIDEVVLRMQGVTDFSKYRADVNSKEEELMLDFFLPENPYNTAKPLPLQVMSKL